MEIDYLQRKYTFKFKITFDRHNARQKLTYCLLPDPPHFSLPSTLDPFKHNKCAATSQVKLQKRMSTAFFDVLE